MLGVIAVVIGSLTVLTVFAVTMVRVGLRTGDLPADATVSAALAGSGQPDEARPVVLVRVRNPGDSPLLAGFSARRRRMPGFADAGGMIVRVPRRTARPSLRAPVHDVVGVVAASGEAEFAVAVAGRRGHRYLVTAALGQAGGRLRVLKFPVSGRHDPGSSSPAAAPVSSTT